MTALEWLLRRAEREFVREGVLSLSTAMELIANGIDAGEFEANLQTQYALLEEELGVETEEESFDENCHS